MSLSVKTQGGGGGGLSASIFVKGLSESDVVTATRKVSPLPDGYTPLAHIESTGTQHIDTLYKPTQNTRVEIKATAKDASSVRALFGSRKSGTEHTFLVWARSSGGKVAYALSGSTIDTTTAWASGATHTIVLQNGLLKIDEAVTPFDAASSFSSSYNLLLLALNDGGSTDSRKFVGEVYYAKIYEGEVLMRDYVPAKRNSDDAIGLYDLVTKAFFSNAGTGSFIAGAEQYIDGAVKEGVWTERADGGGHLISRIKDLGMWTVTATDGVKTKTQDVLVDVATEYEIEIDLYKLWLYRDGDECEEVTGGWEKNSNAILNVFDSSGGTVVFYDDSIFLSCTTNSAVATTKNKVSFDGYSKLFVELGNASSGQRFLATNEKSGKLTESPVVSLWIETSNSITETDISGLTGEYYCSFGNESTRNGYFKKLWLKV